MRARRLLTAVAIAACAALLTAAQYWPSLGYGFYYDDYHFIHPYSAAELARVFHGPWDAAGIEVAFYRPLTICFYAARFALLGVNAEAYHILSLLLFAFAAMLLGLFAARTDRATTGVAACAMFTIHPGVPYSAVAWVTNQMHLLDLIVVLTGLHWWFSIRRKAAAWWLPLIVLQVIALMVKEDGVMLIPAVIVLHTARKYLVERDLAQVPVTFVLTAALGIGGLLLFRSSALHGIRAYRWPSFGRAWQNLTRGLIGVFRLVPATRPYQLAASWFVTLLPVAALLGWRKTTPSTRFAIVAGLVLAVLFDLPFVFVVKAEQLHLVVAGASLFLAACGVALIGLMPTRVMRLAAGAAILAGMALMASVARNILRDFEPFGPMVIGHDSIVRDWAAVTMDLRDYLTAKSEPGAAARLSANPAADLEIVRFGFHGPERRPDGETIRWMSQPTADLFVRAGARSIAIGLRHEAGAFREPAQVTILANGRVLDRLTLSDGAPKQSVVVLRREAVSALSRMHHVQIRIDHIWVPAEIIPGSGDRRPLGLQVGPIDVR